MGTTGLCIASCLHLGRGGDAQARELPNDFVMVLATLAGIALVTGQQGYRVKRISACGGCLGNDRR